MKKFDIIIIGSGLGGLLTAALLAKEGKSILVLEKNKQIGGALQSFGLDKKLFESAVHYMGSLSKGQTLYKVFDYLGLFPDLKLKQLDSNCFDQVILGQKVFNLGQEYSRFLEQLAQQFPDQRNGIMKYADELQRVCNHFPLYNLRLGSAEEKKLVIGDSLWYKLSSIISNEELKMVLCANNLLYAGTQYQTPFYQHALIQNSYIEGSWKFKEGSAQLAKLLQKIIQQHGGEVLRNAEVCSIKEKDRKIECVEDVHGNVYFAQHFISNLHPAVTYKMLDSILIRAFTRKRIEQTPLTKSCFMTNVSLKPAMLPYINHNIYFHTDENVWKDTESSVGNNPHSIALFFYEDKNHPGFASAISILGYMDYDELKPWHESVHTTSKPISRGGDYEDWKQSIIESYVSKATQVLPGLKESILATDACTPLSYRDYLATPEGSLYGVRKDVDDLANTTYATRTKIENLFFTGQNINLHGVLGVSITSILTAGELVGLDYLVRKMNQK